MARQDGWFQQEDSKKVWSWPRRRWSCYSAWDSDSYRRDDPPCGWSGSRKRRERRMFADHIAQQLATLLDRQDKIDNTMVTMASEMKELMSPVCCRIGPAVIFLESPVLPCKLGGDPGPDAFRGDPSRERSQRKLSKSLVSSRRLRAAAARLLWSPKQRRRPQQAVGSRWCGVVYISANVLGVRTLCDVAETIWRTRGLWMQRRLMRGHHSTNLQAR